MKPEEILNADLNDIIFEKRNKAYGAYTLRKTYARHILIGGLIIIFAFGGGISAPTVISLIKGPEKIVKVEKKKLGKNSLKSAPPLENTPPPPPPPLVKPPKTITLAVQIVHKEDIKSDDQQLDMSKLPKNIVPGTTTDLTGDVDFSVDKTLTSKVLDTKPKIFYSVEVMPQFPGGSDALNEFLSKNVQYPAMARELGKQGTVWVQFVVNEDGSIGDVQPLNKIGAGCEEEAIRVVKLMPNFTPGIQNGKPVKVYYKVPFNFTLTN